MEKQHKTLLKKIMGQFQLVIGLGKVESTVEFNSTLDQ
jgi:hypothetical protein